MSCEKKSSCSCEPVKYLGAQAFEGDGGGFRVGTPWQMRYKNQTTAPETFRNLDKNADKFGAIVKLGKQTTKTYPCTPLQPGADPKERLRPGRFVARGRDLLENLAAGSNPSAPGMVPPVKVESQPAPALRPAGFGQVAGAEPIAPPTGGFYYF